jgi:transcriptional regulator with XRE-family HTH domain
MLTNLKAALAARRIRQVELALSLKIPPSTLSEIVCGHRQADSGLRTRIAEALRADEAWLFSAVTRIPAPSGATSSESAPLTAGATAGR